MMEEGFGVSDQVDVQNKYQSMRIFQGGEEHEFHLFYQTYIG